MASILENVELKPHTVFKIGGRARFFCEAKTSGDLRIAVEFSRKKNIPFFVLGAGSNVLISDRGFDGLAIKMELLNLSVHRISVKNRVSDIVEAGAGVPMARIVAETVRKGLAGFEWAIGIPGTMGGSVRGNAGCFGSETKDVLETARIFDAEKLETRDLTRDQCQFGYRDSIFKKNPRLIVLSATLRLVPGDASASQKLVQEYSERRRASQDIGAQCAGCMFKNVLWSREGVDKSVLLKNFPLLQQFSSSPTIPAAFLIDQLELRGAKIGGAQISDKHANYFVNVDNSTAEDVMALVSMVKDRVRRAYGITLEEEVQFVAP